MNEPISVTYSFVDGAHFFTSTDSKWCGLCSASTDLKAAWEDVSVQLNILAEENHGIKGANFKPAESLEEFSEKIVQHLTDRLTKLDALIAELEAEAAKLDHFDSGHRKSVGIAPRKQITWSREEKLAA